jgi:hypothetical protein
MATVGTATNACAGSSAFLYQRHRPEKTLLYQLVSKHYPVFMQQLAEEGRLFENYSPHWPGNADSAIRSVRRPGCAQPEYSLSQFETVH